jgi:hypothetical protein
MPSAPMAITSHVGAPKLNGADDHEAVEQCDQREAHVYLAYGFVNLRSLQANGGIMLWPWACGQFC